MTTNTGNPKSPYWTWGYTNNLVGVLQNYRDIDRIALAHNTIVVELEAALEAEAQKRADWNVVIEDLEQRVKNQAGVIEEMQVERDAMERDLESIERTLALRQKEKDRLYDENQELKRWKNEQMKVAADTNYHEIAKELGWLTLGDNIAEAILPAIRSYKREIERLKGMITDLCEAYYNR